jgi:anti-sigma regulatory factor (Ser/Thr protein kinase)
MRSAGSRLRHCALVYSSEEEYLRHAVPFVREGLEASEGVIVANTKHGLAMMREALGSDAVQVTFIDVSSAYTRPARALAAYHDVFVKELRKTASLRAVSDVQVGPDPGEWDLWTAYEAVTNRSFGHLPVWVMCTYDRNGVSASVLETVWQTHPEVLAGNAWSKSDHYEHPDRLLRRITPEPEPLRDLRSLEFGSGTDEFRERLARELVVAGVPEARVLDMLLAATEVATNAVEHGGGIEDIRVGWAQGRFVCEIVDRGDGFDDPAAGYLAPRPGIGTGLWVARQLTWRIEVFRAPAGFTTRLWL